MAPEIEWDVDTDSTREVLAKTPPPSPSSPRTKITLLIVIAIGVTLGVTYRSIPEPSPSPTPTLVPTSILVPLRSIGDTIDQEARALELGALQVFVGLQDPANLPWRAQQIKSFQKWGEPTDSSDLYTIVMSGTLGSDRRWADINQARNGQFFRETRFYRLINGQWTRTAPADSFWGDERLLRTNHFDLIYRERDDYHVQIVAQQLEKFYSRICQDLNCTLGQSIDPLVIRVCRISNCGDGPEVDPNPVPMFTVILSPTAPATTMSGYTEQHITTTMPSPRISGLYFQSLYNGAPGNDEPIEWLAVNELNLPYAITKIAAGGVVRWSNSMQGDLFLEDINAWENNRLKPIPAAIDTFTSLSTIKNKGLQPLDVLWRMTPPFSMPQTQADILAEESRSVIQFIEIKYGPDGVVRFLNAIGPAQSISDALQNGLNVSYVDFDQEWWAWLKAELAK